MNNFPDKNAQSGQQPQHFAFGTTATSAPQQSSLFGAPNPIVNPFSSTAAPGNFFATSAPSSGGTLFGATSTFSLGQSVAMTPNAFGSPAQSSAAAFGSFISATGSSLGGSTSFSAPVGFGSATQSVSSSFLTPSLSITTPSFGTPSQSTLFGPGSTSTAPTFAPVFTSQAAPFAATSGSNFLASATTFFSPGATSTGFGLTGQSSGPTLMTPPSTGTFFPASSAAQSGSSIFNSASGGSFVTGSAFPSQTSGPIFRPSSSGGFGFPTATAPASPVQSAALQSPRFNFSRTTGAGSYASGAGMFFNAAPAVQFSQSSPGAASRSSSTTPDLFAPNASWSFQPTASPRGQALYGNFPTIQPTMRPPSGISPAVSLASQVPIPAVTPQTASTASTSAAPAPPPRVSEIQPDPLPTTSSPATTSPPTAASSPPAAMRSGPFALAVTSPPSTASPAATMAPAVAPPATTTAPAVVAAPLRGPEIGAILHVALPLGREMEDRFRIFADRLADNDVLIRERGAELEKLTQTYKEHISQQKWIEKQMQYMEHQTATAFQRTKEYIERMKTLIPPPSPAPIAALAEMYEGLRNFDAFFSEMQSLMERACAENAAPMKSRVPASGPSLLEAEQLLLQLRKLEDERENLAREIGHL